MLGGWGRGGVAKYGMYHVNIYIKTARVESEKLEGENISF